MEGKQNEGSAETENHQIEDRGKAVQGDCGRAAADAWKRENVHVQAEAGRGAEEVRDVREVSAECHSPACQEVLLRPVPRQMVGCSSGSNGIEAQFRM